MEMPAAAEKLHRSFAGKNLNYALICGKTSGVVVLDADTPQAAQWLRQLGTYVVETAKGCHAYFRHPGRIIRNGVRVQVAPGVEVDVRGDGGYVVGPMSIHETGVVYSPRGRIEDMLPFPDSIEQKITNARKRSR